MNSTLGDVCGWLLLSVLVLLALWVIVDSRPLRNGEQRDATFSFSRSQLFFWSVVVLGTWVGRLAFSRGAELWSFNVTTIALLGMSLATTASARVVDSPRTAQASEGFLRDILSEGSGPTVHRFQCLMFNLAYGSWFLICTLAAGASGFPDWNATTLALLGVSSGGYLMVKTGGNAPQREVRPK